jgi:hypothetical protein
MPHVLTILGMSARLKTATNGEILPSILTKLLGDLLLPIISHQREGTAVSSHYRLDILVDYVILPGSTSFRYR